MNESQSSSWGDIAVVNFFLSKDRSGMSILTNPSIPEEMRVETLKDIIRKQSPNMNYAEIDRLARLAAPELLK